MPSLPSIDLIVQDVPRAVAFFREVAGLHALQEYDRFAELDAGNLRLLLSPDALVPVTPAAGVILHFSERDLAAAGRRAVTFGTAILKGPFITDWGTESLLVQGPESIVVDFYRPAF
jgi:catechol 2,3-dioxygenase-like lactoylglutathione lyase family enzyme